MRSPSLRKSLVALFLGTLLFALLPVTASGCVVRTPGVEVRSVAVSVERRTCPKRYFWNGERCVKRHGHGHYKHHWHRHYR